MTYFETFYKPIDSFYLLHTKMVGYDLVLGFQTEYPKRQKIIYCITGFIFLLNLMQVTTDITSFDNYGDMAITVILFNSAWFSAMTSVNLAYFRKDYKILLNWCKGLYLKDVDRRFCQFRVNVLQKNSKLTLFFLR